MIDISMEVIREFVEETVTTQDQILNMLPIGIFILDQKSRIIKSNEESLQLTNVIDHRSILGVKLTDLFGDAEKNFLDRVFSLQKKEKIFQEEIHNIFWQVEMISIHEEQDVYLVILSNIKNLISQYESIALEVTRKDSISNIAAGFAHEINNPLMILNNCVDLLGRGINSEKIPMIVDKALNATERIIYLSDVFSSDYLTPEKDIQTINPVHIIEDALAAERSRFKDADIEIEKNFQSEKITSKLSGKALLDILLQLIDNSIYALKDEAYKKIKIEEKSTASHFILEFSDTGIGITDEIKGFMFDAFYSSDHFKKRGLGLYICENKVTNANGNISAQNDFNGGLIITIKIPIEQE